MNWPIGSGIDFKGVYDRERKQVLQFEPDGDNAGRKEAREHDFSLEDEGLRAAIGDSLYETLQEDVELIDGAGYDFDLEKVRHGKLSPVFFGSQLRRGAFPGELLKADHPSPAPEHGPGRGGPL